MLMMHLEGLFVIEITASADQLHSAVEAMHQMFDAFAAYLVVVNLAAAANPAAAAIDLAEFASVTSIAVVVAVIVTVALDLATKLTRSAGFVAALEAWVVAVYAKGADYSACQSCQNEFQAIAAAAVVQ